MTGELAFRLLVAGAGGLAIGIEREWSLQTRGEARFAGVRTFFLMALAGGIAGELALTMPAVAVAILAALAALVIAAYAIAARQAGVDGTTEAAALLVVTTSFLAGIGQTTAASSVYAVTALALAEKSRIHEWIRRTPAPALQAAFRFGVLALVILPLLPEGPYGPPPGILPRETWILVLVFSAISFAGFMALHLSASQTGYGLVGLLGGLVSSTAATLSFARESGARRGHTAEGLALGVSAACTMLIPRILAVSFVLQPELALRAIPFLLPPFVVGLAASAILWSRAGMRHQVPAIPESPLRLGAALQLALAFQVVLYLVHHARKLSLTSGVVGSAALAGLADVDALTYSLARLGEDPGMTELAAFALGVGVLSNSILKLGLVIVLGHGRFRWIAASCIAAIAGSLAVPIGMVAATLSF